MTPAAAPPFTQLLPSLAGPISAVPELSFPSGTIPSWWVNSPPSGFLAPPVTTGPTLSLIPPGGTGPVIQPNPIPGWSLPPTTVAPTGFTPGLPPTGPVPSTPVVAVVPPYIFPPDIWPTVPILPLVPGLPTIPQTPTQPTGPVQPVPEPGLLLPTLLACAAFAVAKSRWGRRRTPPSPITPRPPRLRITLSAAILKVPHTAADNSTSGQILRRRYRNLWTAIRCGYLFSVEPDHCVLRLAGALGVASAEELRLTALELCAYHKDVVVDWSGATQLDTGIAQVLLSLRAGLGERNTASRRQRRDSATG